MIQVPATINSSLVNMMPRLISLASRYVGYCELAVILLPSISVDMRIVIKVMKPAHKRPLNSDFLASWIFSVFAGYIIIIVITGNTVKHDKTYEPLKIGIIPFSKTGCRFSNFIFGETRSVVKTARIRTKRMYISEARAIVSIPYNTAITTAMTNIKLMTYGGVSGMACVVTKLATYHGRWYAVFRHKNT